MAGHLTTDIARTARRAAGRTIERTTATMKALRIAATAGTLLALAAAPDALADSPETLQAQTANAGFLAQAPAPAGGSGAVCVIDSGVDTDTDLGPALAGRVAYDGGTPGDVGARGDDGSNLTKHGTYVAGVIASQLDGSGSSGIWPRAKIISDRVFSGPTSGTTAARYIAAIARCQQQPDVKVINLSLAGLTASAAELESLENAIENVRGVWGINVVAAAGNQNQPAVAYPAQFSSVFAVGGITASGARWTEAAYSGSNYGAGLDISTLAKDVCVTMPAALNDTLLGKARGTSFAAPVVSAVIAAMRSYAPAITVDQAEAALLASATTTSAGKTLNAAAAFQYAAANYGAPELATLVSNYTAGSPFDCEAPPVTSGGGGGGGSGGVSGGGGGGGAQAPTERAPVAPAPAPAQAMTEAATPAPMIVPALPVERASLPRTAAPKLRSVTLRRGVLRVRISGYRRGMRAIFSVDGRRYVRKSAVLRVKRRSWKTVRVQLKQADHRVSRTLIIRRGQEF